MNRSQKISSHVSYNWEGTGQGQWNVPNCQWQRSKKEPATFTERLRKTLVKHTSQFFFYFPIICLSELQTILKDRLIFQLASHISRMNHKSGSTLDNLLKVINSVSNIRTRKIPRNEREKIRKNLGPHQPKIPMSFQSAMAVVRWNTSGRQLHTPINRENKHGHVLSETKVVERFIDPRDEALWGFVSFLAWSNRMEALRFQWAPTTGNPSK